ncbi:hypothetical protein ABW21_db0204290 [Orbilia brochopaga]|nr:hypothetical protein ABW21_db0204290 [Drechslerella brochopaga]
MAPLVEGGHPTSSSSNSNSNCNSNSNPNPTSNCNGHSNTNGATLRNAGSPSQANVHGYKNNNAHGHVHNAFRSGPDSAANSMMPHPSSPIVQRPGGGLAEKPAISLITGVSPVINKSASASSISSNPSSALTTPSTAVSSIPTSLPSGGPHSASPSRLDGGKNKLPSVVSTLGEHQMASSAGLLPSLSHNGNGSALPSFHHHHPPHHRPPPFYQPAGSQLPPTMNSPFPSPDDISSRRDEFMPRPFSGYPTAIPIQSPSGPFGDGCDFDDERSRKRYGRPPGAKDKRPRRRRTKAQMEEDALIYGYRDSESVYHSPTSLAKRRRLSPRRDSLEDSAGEEANSPTPQPAYAYPVFNSFPGSQPPQPPAPLPVSQQSSQPSFNPFLHRHHLPNTPTNSIPPLSSFKPPEAGPASRPNTDSPWPPRPVEHDRMPGSQIPDSRPGPGDFGPSRGPPSPISHTPFPPINARRGSGSFLRQAIFHGEQVDHRGRDFAPRYSPLPPDRGREIVSKWEPPVQVPPPVPPPQNTLPRLGELPRISDFPLDRPRWDKPVDDISRQPDFDRRGGGMRENKLASISPLNTSHLLNGNPPPPDPNASQRKMGSPGSSRPPFSDILRPGPELPPATAGDRPFFREARSGSITNITVGPMLEAETPKRDEEDTDEQIEEYRARMLEQHSSYYNNGALGKTRVKREPSYAMPGKSPLQEENERLRSALQRYRQQKGIERLKLEEFINRRCNGDQGMIKELLTITGHIAEDDYVGPVKPSCL